MSDGRKWNNGISRTALGSVQTNNTHSHGPVDEQTLPPRSGMNPDQGVDTFDEFRACFGVISVKVRVRTSINCQLSIQESAERRAQFLVCSVTRSLRKLS